MSKRSLRFDPNRRFSLDESPRGPLVKAIFAVLTLLAAAVLVVFLWMPAMRRKSAFPDKTPAPTADAASPAPTETPGLPAVAVHEEKTLLLPEALSSLPVLDARVLEGQLYFVTGADARNPDTLVQYDLTEGTATVRERPEGAEGAVRRLVGNGRYLTYLCMNAAQGGSIRVIDRRTGADEWLCDFIDGAPELLLFENVLCYRARTGEQAAKLFAVDLYTRASAVAAVFSDSATISSRVTLSNGRLVFTEAAGATESVIVGLDIKTGKRAQWTVGGAAFDPAAAGEGIAYLSAPNGPDAALYYAPDAGEGKCIAERAEVFSISGDCAVYQTGGGIFAYALTTGEYYPLAEGGARLLAAENGYIVWQEASDAGETVIRYLETE